MIRKIAIHWHAPRTSEALRRLLVQGRTFVVLALFSFIIFVAAGLAGLAYQQSSSSQWPMMNGAAASLSDGLLAEMTRMELPAFESETAGGGIDGKQTAAFLIRFFTGIDPVQPRSLLAGELPGLRSDRSVLLRPGSGGEHGIGPQDRPPLPVPEDEAAPVPPAENAPEPEEEDGAAAETPPADKEPVVFIYHSHNRESWLPELGEDAKNPESGEINITLVGRRLAERLEEKGVGTLHSNVDYMTAIEDYRWELSYKYSKNTVVEAMSRHEGLTYLFDIHRDSQPRGYTTATIDGKAYAQVYFIIGKGNPDWRENESFAARIHGRLEERYPGISRGIWGKDASSGNGEYNQSLSPNSLVIEIGGIENTLEECYRTADALAEIIAELYWSEAEAAETSGGI